MIYSHIEPDLTDYHICICTICHMANEVLSSVSIQPRFNSGQGTVSTSSVDVAKLFWNFRLATRMWLKPQVPWHQCVVCSLFYLWACFAMHHESTPEKFKLGMHCPQKQTLHGPRTKQPLLTCLHPWLSWRWWWLHCNCSKRSIKRAGCKSFTLGNCFTNQVAALLHSQLPDCQLTIMQPFNALQGILSLCV